MIPANQCTFAVGGSLVFHVLFMAISRLSLPPLSPLRLTSDSRTLQCMEKQSVFPVKALSHPRVRLLEDTAG